MPSDRLPSPLRLASAIVNASKVRHRRFILGLGSVILVLPPCDVPPLEPPKHPPPAPFAGNVFRSFNRVGVADDPAPVRFDTELLNVAFHVAPYRSKIITSIASSRNTPSAIILRTLMLRGQLQGVRVESSRIA